MFNNVIGWFTMKIIQTLLHCESNLIETFGKELEEIYSIVKNIKWVPSFQYIDNVDSYEHQTGYNKEFANRFVTAHWEPQPLLRTEPKLIGDFRKSGLFVEIQFGNSSTLYRDYYKFQYGSINNLISLSVLIVPSKPNIFFPTRPRSVLNMASYELAVSYFSILPINVPVMVIGLLSDN
jgi:hypothetical protein